ncbi:MAG: DinB family protein [Chitinophagaceae bacterium]|nr:DinB family protein [Chitinophagaceae bacterium]
MKKIAKPERIEHALYYNEFIDLVDENESVLMQLKNNAKEIEFLLKSLTNETLNSSYAPEKWSIKDILMHLCDCERVFLYRAMRFARGDRSALSFFDENEYAKQAKANDLTIKYILKEYKTARATTLAFFQNQRVATLKKCGISSNASMSVRACAWIICGHELHHFNVIKTRYLNL